MSKKVFDISKIQNSKIIDQPKVVQLPDDNFMDYWAFGINNLFPDELAFLNRTSPTHMGILSAKERYFAAKTDQLKSTNKAVHLWYNKPNNKPTYSQHDLRTDFFKSWNGNGNNYIEIVTDSKKSFINTFIKDYTKCRLGNKKYSGTVLIFDNWQFFQGLNKTTKVLPMYPNFTKSEEDGLWRSILVIRNKQNGYTPYGLPDWLAGLDCAETLKGINTWNKSRVKTGFSSDGVLEVDVESQNQANELETKFKQSKTGDENAGNVVVIKKAVGGEPATFTQLNRTSEGEFIQLRDISVTDLITAHGWFRSLCSIPDNTGFETNRILNEYYLALPSQIIPAQEFFVSIFDRIMLDFYNYSIIEDYKFINLPPIKDKSCMYIWEVRKMNGLDYNENDAKQQEFYNVNNNSNGTRNTK